ncbi:tRNA pseudouridine32 synthase/23S rRNA pseudouridine746 synthase [Mitsuaria sp. BK045]|uniref:pseudouridine synthase n=1 Tax=unclassified Roseateles TaxID=2626991 RepID=UPI00160FF948|nr:MULTISPECIES: pseudouridine synthase [unclassified Roseateles]MBB3295959.1 tRNA pseudouridine32 synthase/23S rRNA pseudouridine746 synthase [Mitsuaria sp. BK041]MBB3365174.1 tRNA pseudouridine32 synthase/23S rRNA pseudouridine746 synthase [Mitsuaria sp. BK045]
MARPPKLDLPLRDGVAASALACPPGSWPLVLDFLAERLPLVARDDWAMRMKLGDVLDDAGTPLSPDAPYRAQRRLYYWRWLAAEPEVPGQARVLHLDEHLLVADKPHFLPVTPKGRYVQQTLLTRLRRETGLADLSPIHRLDRETAGLTLFSVRPATRDAYQRLFRDRDVEKVYEAIAPWRDEVAARLPFDYESRLEEHPVDFMQMRTVAGEPNARTRIALLERLAADRARYELRPHSGVKHQLRAQLCALGLPIEGDRIYPVLRPVEDEVDFSRPLQLLAREIAFTDPISGQPRKFVTSLKLAGSPAPG